ncbi:MAG TPA: TPM domain-containing protein [Kofleriaceae bacterium]|nr:TPM domain-containing protein [Kofleriaceae bacterium]
MRRGRAGIDRDRVRAAIEGAERQTSAEIVVSIAPFFLGGVAPAARHAFTRLGVARTRARNGVLIFVVPSRHQVVVLPDEAAEARLHPDVVADAARRVAAGFGRDDGTGGLVDGIAVLAGALAPLFPPAADDVDELPPFEAP